MTKFIGIGLVAFILFVLQRWLYRKLWNRNLKVKIQFSDTQMLQGETGELVEVVENRKRLPLPMLKVKFQTDRNLKFYDTESSKVTDHFYRNDVFQIGGRERITRKHTFKALKRGYYKILGIDLVSADLFLVTEMVESRREECALYVYPIPYCSPEFQQSLQQLNGEILVRRHLLEDPFEYRGVREYQPYDDMRSVNWKATAKTGELKVNQKNHTSLQTIRILLNTEDTGILKKEDAVETCFALAAGVAAYFLKQGIRVSLFANGVDIMNSDPVRIGAGAGDGQMDRIFKALARIDVTKKVVPFRECFGPELSEQKDCIRTIVISPNAYQDFQDFIREFYETGGEFEWFYPVKGKEVPELPQWLSAHVRFVPAKEGVV